MIKKSYTKLKGIFTVCVIAMTAMILCCTAYGASTITPAKPAVGDGSTAAPFEIGSAEELYWFADYVNQGNGGNANAVLTGDITINSETLSADSLGSDNLIKWVPIGTEANPYSSKFDGGNYMVSGLYFDDSTKSYVGFFGKASNADIDELTVINSVLQGEYYIGGICGAADSTTSITRCANHAVLIGTDKVGGITGAGGNINDSYNSGSININDTSSSMGGGYFRRR